MRKNSVLGLGPHGFHRVAYTEWGEVDNPRVLICVHGLSRNGRDFDVLAEAMQDRYRVLCPDIVGRGDSQWLTHPGDYNYPQYLADMNALIARANPGELHWVGTSMGGLIGMMLAGQAHSPIRRLVMNDVGPFIPKASLERLAQYVGRSPTMQSLDEVEQYLRVVMAPFGKLTDAQWRHMAEHSAKQSSNGNFVLHYDPAIADVFKGPAIQDISLWTFWQGVTCPVLVIRGAESDLLLPETVRQMQVGRSNVESIEVPNTGHAPALMDNAQVFAIRKFLLES
ncbi:MAG: alpha/beta hydrolase [Pseudomonadota bacterium]|nr:alpha/beta hydrolase [Pseudomonadota bacterium]